MDTPSDTADPDGVPPQLRWLKRLVMILTGIMIAGFALLVGVLIVKLTAPPVPLPDRIELPAGKTASAYTQGNGWAAVVTTDGQILIFDMATGALRQSFDVDQ